MEQRIMVMYFILVTNILLVAGSSSPDPDIRIPPSILPTSTPSHMLYRSDQNVVLHCQATGSPQPRYIWYLNGEVLNLKWRGHLKVTPDPTNGTLTIKSMSSLDEGYYQCYARNPYGTSVSKVFYLQRAVLGMYPPRSIQSYTVKEGMPLRMTCIDLKSIPKPTYSWVLAQSKSDWAPDPLITTSRIVLDADGYLYFTHVTKDDEKLVFGESLPSLLYKCNVFNRYLDMMTAGSYSRIIVESGDGLDKKPTTLFVTPSPLYVVKGENIRIQCIFAGKPTVDVTWDRKPGGRGKIDQSNTVLEISQVRFEDAGTYTCTGHNAAGSESETVQVVVQSKPELLQRPININATEGETVSIECRSTIDTRPQADINWYINGEPLDPVAPGPRTEISDGGHRLTIRNVCKDCQSGTTDLKVIQCNASNVHGYAFAEGYLNVLLVTVISTAPEDLTINTDSSLAVFHCEAHSDPSTPVSFLWTRDGRQLSYYQDERMATKESTTGITLTINLHDVTLGEKRKYEGVYNCIATNQYSTAEGSAKLMIDDEAEDGCQCYQSMSKIAQLIARQSEIIERQSKLSEDQKNVLRELVEVMRGMYQPPNQGNLSPHHRPLDLSKGG